jgi:hypothetical protein
MLLGLVGRVAMVGERDLQVRSDRCQEIVGSREEIGVSFCPYPYPGPLISRMSISRVLWEIELDYGEAKGCALKYCRVAGPNCVERTRVRRDLGYGSVHAGQKSQNLDAVYICSPSECLMSSVRGIVFEVEVVKECVVSFPDAMKLSIPLQNGMDFEMSLVEISYGDFGLMMDFDFSDVFLVWTNGGYLVLTCQSLACPATPYLYFFLELRRGCLLLGIVNVSVSGLG